MLLKTRDSQHTPALPGPGKHQAMQRSPSQAPFIRMCILKRKWSLQRDSKVSSCHRSSCVLSCAHLPSGSSPLPGHTCLLCFPSRPDFTPPSLCSFLYVTASLFPCFYGSSSDPALSKHCLPPYACGGTAALVWFFAVHLFVPMSGDLNRC